MHFPSFFSFQGRIGRLEYWITYFSLVPLYVVAGLLSLGGAVGGLLSFIASMALAWVGWASVAKRLHDTGRSLWWFVGYVALGAASGLAWLLTIGDVADAARAHGAGGPQVAGPMLALFALAYFIWAGIGLWVLGFKRSDVGNNRFGGPHGGTALFKELAGNSEFARAPRAEPSAEGAPASDAPQQ